MDEKKQNKKAGFRAAWIFLALIIIVRLFMTIYCYEVRKTGIFGDEIWSYGLANSYYKPFIYLEKGISIDDVENYKEDNFNEWVDGDVFERYITVQEGERFAYGSVVSNQSLDHHPPLYYMLLHTVCSFFPNKFSYGYAFALSCIFLVVSLIYLYRLGKLITGSEIKGIVLTAFYGLGQAAHIAFLYLRQYNLLTMLVLMAVFYSARFFYNVRDGKEKPVKDIIPVMITSFLAFNTHYYGIIFIGILTAGICLWLLIHKRIKLMFIFGGCVTASLGLFFLLYPASIKQALTYDVFSVRVMTYSETFRVILKYALMPTLGISVGLFRGYAVYTVLAVIVVAAVISVPLCFLFRNEKWFRNFVSSLKELLKKLPGKIVKIDPICLILFLCVAGTLVFINRQVNAFYYQKFMIRYYLHVLPFICIAAFYILDRLFALLPEIKGKKLGLPVTAVICAVMTVRGMILLPCPFYSSTPNDKNDVREALAGKNCVLIISDYKSFLENFTALLGKTSKDYCVSRDELPEHIDEIRSFDGDIDYFIVYVENYVLSDRQYAEYQKLLKTADDKKAFADIVRYDELEETLEREGKSDSYYPEEAVEEDEERLSEISDFVDEFCPNEEYDPAFIQDINGAAYIIFEHRK